MSRYSDLTYRSIPDNQKLIKTISDIPPILDPNTVYIIDGRLDIQTNSLVVGEGGGFIRGHGYGISSLFSTENNVDIIKAAPGYSGNVILNGLELWTSGTNSQIFNLDNQNNNAALEMNRVNLGTFSATTSCLGTVANYRQVRTSDFAAIRYAEGFKFLGTFSGMAFNDSILLANQPNSTFLSAGAGFSLSDGLSSNMNALGLDNTSTWADFAPTNFLGTAQLFLSNFRATNINALPNMPETAIQAKFKDCIGINNTYVGAALTFVTETPTTYSGVPAKALGTTTANLDAYFVAEGNNRLKYIGYPDAAVSVIAPTEISTAGQEEIEVSIRHWQNALSQFNPINIDSRLLETRVRLTGARKAANTLSGTALLKTGDYIELWQENVANNNSSTITEGSKLIIQQRF